MKDKPPFRAEHIGSLLRPKKVLDSFGKGDAAQEQDRAIEDVLRWQESLGLRVVTDGEFRRESWRLGFISKVKGFARADASATSTCSATTPATPAKWSFQRNTLRSS